MQLVSQHTKKFEKQTEKRQIAGKCVLKNSEYISLVSFCHLTIIYSFNGAHVFLHLYSVGVGEMVLSGYRRRVIVLDENQSIHDVRSTLRQKRTSWS